MTTDLVTCSATPLCNEMQEPQEVNGQGGTKIGIKLYRKIKIFHCNMCDEETIICFTFLRKTKLELGILMCCSIFVLFIMTGNQCKNVSPLTNPSDM